MSNTEQHAKDGAISDRKADQAMVESMRAKNIEAANAAIQNAFLRIQAEVLFGQGKQ